MRTAFAIILILVAGAGVPAGADDSVVARWRVVQAVGEYSLHTGTLVAVAIDPNLDLPADTVVTTGSDGRIVLKRGADQIVVSPNTRIALPDNRDTTTRIMQEFGDAWFHIGKGQAPHFQVDTPYLAALVKGTTFTVTADALGSAVHVSEGAVEVATAWRDAVTLVKPGSTVRVRRDQADQIEVVKSGRVANIISTPDGSSQAGAGALRLGFGRSTSPGAMFARAAELYAAGSNPEPDGAMILANHDVAGDTAIDGRTGGAKPVNRDNAEVAVNLKRSIADEPVSLQSRAEGRAGAISNEGQTELGLAANVVGSEAGQSGYAATAGSLDTGASNSGSAQKIFGNLSRSQSQLPLKSARLNMQLPFAEILLGALLLLVLILSSQVAVLKRRASDARKTNRGAE